MYLSWMLRIFALLVVCHLLLGMMDDDLLEKDLYKILELDKDASVHEIKKSYRRLARENHPDKVSDDLEKAKRGDKFREIASAYEVLNDQKLRDEYDYLRLAKHHGPERNYHSNSGSPGHSPFGDDHRYYETFDPNDMHKQHVMFEDIFDMYEQMMNQAGPGVGGTYTMDFDDDGNSIFSNDAFGDMGGGMGDLFDDFFKLANRGGGVHHHSRQHHSHIPRFSYSITDSPFMAQEIITPYSPIILSPDRSHIAYLDMHCSFNVIAGNINDFLSYMQNGIASGKGSSILVDVPNTKRKFRTPEQTSLKGYCFAGLDSVGSFSVFAGSPHSNYNVIWSTDREEKDEQDVRNAEYKLFTLNLFDSGELMVTCASRFSSFEGNDFECIWSTTNCSKSKRWIFAVEKISRGARSLIRAIQEEGVVLSLKKVLARMVRRLLVMMENTLHRFDI